MSMTDQHRATPEQWETIEQYTGSSDPYSCIIEHRARIEALGAVQPRQGKLARLIALDADDGDPIVMPSSPADLLIDRVAQAIYDAPNNHEGWRSEARAAILEVAAWLRGRNTRVAASVQVAGDLEKEANQ